AMLRSSFISVTQAIVFCGLSAAAHAAGFPALMPMPAKVVPGSGSLVIDSSFRVSADAKLAGAAERLTARIFRRTGMPRVGTGRPRLVVECAGLLTDDESYELDVTAAGSRVVAHTTAGALHGMETFDQLITPGPSGFQVPAVHIEDRPRFPWRGLMLDVS